MERKDIEFAAFVLENLIENSGDFLPARLRTVDEAILAMALNVLDNYFLGNMMSSMRQGSMTPIASYDQLNLEDFIPCERLTRLRSTD